VDIRKLKGKTMVLPRRTTGGKLVKTKHSRRVCK
jgi:hypothetical protein